MDGAGDVAGEVGCFIGERVACRRNQPGDDVGHDDYKRLKSRECGVIERVCSELTKDGVDDSGSMSSITRLKREKPNTQK